MSFFPNSGWIPTTALALLAVLQAGALNMTTQRWENCDNLGKFHNKIMFEHTKNIYVCSNNMLHVVDASNGGTRWNSPTMCYEHIEPLINNDGIVIFGFDGEFGGAATLEARDSNDGTLKWAQEMWGYWWLHCLPVFSTNGETVFMMSTAKNLTALDASSGAMRWSYIFDYQLQGFWKGPEASKGRWEPFLTSQTGYEKPEILGSTIFVWSDAISSGDYNFTVHAIDTTTGKLKWKYAASSLWVIEFPEFKLLQSVDGHTVFLNADPILALSIDTGTLKWDPVDCLLIGASCKLVMSEDGQTLFTFRNATAEETELIAFSAAKRTLQWRLMLRKPTFYKFTELLRNTDGSRLFCLARSREYDNETLFAVDTEDGTLMWNRTLDSRMWSIYERSNRRSSDMFLSGSGLTLCLYHYVSSMQPADLEASVLTCFDAITGKPKWAVDTGYMFKLNVSSSSTESLNLDEVISMKIDLLDAGSKVLLRNDNYKFPAILLMDLETGTFLWQSHGEKLDDLVPSNDGRTFYEIPQSGRLSAQALRCIGNICCPTEHEFAQAAGGCDPVASQPICAVAWALRSRMGLAAALLLLAVGLYDPLFSTS